MDTLPESVRRMIEATTGNEGNDSDSSHEDSDSFSFILSQEEVVKVYERQFIDFAAIYSRHQRAPYGMGTQSHQPSPKKGDMSVKDWARIFLAFQAENARWHPKEATALPAYGDLILKMEDLNMQWAKYDVIFRQKRAKQIIRRPRKVKSWSTTDIELYLSCEALREPTRAPTTKKQPFSASTQQPDNNHYRSGTCWKFQSPKGCEGPCLWPSTHKCYTCGGPHPTNQCNTDPQPSESRNTDTTIAKIGHREDRDRRDRTSGERAPEEWRRGNARH